MQKLESFSLRNNVSLIAMGARAFKGCNALQTVKLGSSLTRIQTSAFENCLRLKVLEIPESVTDVEPFAFAGCRRLAGCGFT